MKPSTTEQLQSYVAELIAAGEEVVKHSGTVGTPGYSEPIVNLDLFSEWTARCGHLATLLGEHARPWNNTLRGTTQNYLGNAKYLLGTLKAIEKTLRAGLLIRVEDLVRADAFADLLEQADYLLAEGYHVAAGVLGRAVLEEHLRNWCDRAGCMPSKERPTLADYNVALYKAKHLDKLTMKQVEALIAVGNSAAHGDPDLKSEDVARMLRDVRDFVAQHPLS